MAPSSAQKSSVFSSSSSDRMYWKSESSPPAPMMVWSLTLRRRSKDLYRLVDPYDPASHHVGHRRNLVLMYFKHFLTSRSSKRYISTQRTAVDKALPSVSAASNTPSLYVTPRTDVPVTYGVLHTVKSVLIVQYSSKHHDRR